MRSVYCNSGSTYALREFGREEWSTDPLECKDEGGNQDSAPTNT